MPTTNNAQFRKEQFSNSPRTPSNQTPKTNYNTAMNRLEQDFFLQPNVVIAAQQLLGKVLVTNFDGQKTAGKIVETEAYQGPEDKACHAYNNRRTARTSIMFEAGGLAYITLCYGIHYLFNVVTGAENCPHAVLIRAIEPLEGLPIMLARRNLTSIVPRLSNGPGSLSKALGITTSYHGKSLCHPNSEIWLEDAGVTIPPADIINSPRVGIPYAEEWKDIPWRFRIADSHWIGK